MSNCLAAAYVLRVREAEPRKGVDFARKVPDQLCPGLRRRGTQPWWNSAAAEGVLRGKRGPILEAAPQTEPAAALATTDPVRVARQPVGCKGKLGWVAKELWWESVFMLLRAYRNELPETEVRAVAEHNRTFHRFGKTQSEPVTIGR